MKIRFRGLAVFKTPCSDAKICGTKCTACYADKLNQLTHNFESGLGGNHQSVQVLLKAYAKLGVHIAAAIEPDDVPASGLPVILSMQDGTTVEPDDIVALQPELQDAVLRLLGQQRMTS